MGDFKAFADRMKKRTADVAHNISIGQKKVTVVVANSLIEDTPIDTGKAKSNWRASSGRTARNTREAFFPGMRGSTQEQNEGEAKREAFEKIAKAKPGNTIFIQNNVDYIVPLNQGTISAQPSGFVEKALVRGQKAVNRIKLLGKRLSL